MEFYVSKLAIDCIQLQISHFHCLPPRGIWQQTNMTQLVCQLIVTSMFVQLDCLVLQVMFVYTKRCLYFFIIKLSFTVKHLAYLLLSCLVNIF